LLRPSEREKRPREKQTGNPQGEVKKFAGVDTYFAPYEGKEKSAIVISTDAFGYQFINTKLVADSLAKQTGFLCVVPDIFANDPMSPDVFEIEDQEKRMQIFGPWIGRQGYPDVKLPIFHAVFKELREKGFQKIGVTGYCYGGRISALLAAQDEATAVVVAHPSTLKPSEIEAIKKPTLWICAETDPTFSASDRKGAEEILQKKGLKNTFKDYPGTTHGFAIRGDDKDPKVQQAKIEALEATINFFKEELSK